MNKKKGRDAIPNKTSNKSPNVQLVRTKRRTKHCMPNKTLNKTHLAKENAPRQSSRPTRHTFPNETPNKTTYSKRSRTKHQTCTSLNSERRTLNTEQAFTEQKTNPNKTPNAEQRSVNAERRSWPSLLGRSCCGGAAGKELWGSCWGETFGDKMMGRSC